MIALITIGIFILRLIYAVMKLFPCGHKIVFLSRQSDSLSVDYSKLIDSIKEAENPPKIVVYAKRQEKETGLFISFVISNGFFILRQMWALATSRVAIVDGYSIPVSILKHKKSLRVVQLWHATGAIKKMGLQTLPYMNERERKNRVALKMHENYSYVVSCSEECNEFYAEALGVNTTEVLPLGTPHLDYLFCAENNKSEEILSKFSHLREKKVLLYVPTYRTIEGKQDFMNALEILCSNIDYNNYNLIIKLHPVDYHDKEINEILQKSSSKSSEKGKGDGILLIKEYSSEELLSICDYVITDYSSLAFDAGLLGVPVYFYIYDIEQYKLDTGLNIDVEEEYSKYSSRDIIKILSLMDENYDFGYMNTFINKYISCYDGKCTQRLKAFILKLLDENN